MKIGYVDIVGDLFHYNHILFLKKCKEFCDYLIVGVCSDTFCEKYKRKPILTEKERLYSIQLCNIVDYSFIVEDDEIYITKQFMDKYKIDRVFHAHSIDENEIYNIYYKYPISVNKFKRLDYNTGISTTTIINRIKKAVNDRNY